MARDDIDSVGTEAAGPGCWWIHQLELDVGPVLGRAAGRPVAPLLCKCCPRKRKSGVVFVNPLRILVTERSINTRVSKFSSQIWLVVSGFRVVTGSQWAHCKSDTTCWRDTSLIQHRHAYITYCTQCRQQFIAPDDDQLLSAMVFSTYFKTADS